MRCNRAHQGVTGWKRTGWQVSAESPRLLEERQGGLLHAAASRRTATHAMRVRNTKRTGVNVTVKDRVPSSRNKDIKARRHAATATATACTPPSQPLPLIGRPLRGAALFLLGRWLCATSPQSRPRAQASCWCACAAVPPLRWRPDDPCACC